MAISPKRPCGLALSVIALGLAAGGGQAQDATSPAERSLTGKANWMHEFVTLRVEARTARATGEPASPGLLEIVGGADATPDQNPFQVALLTKSQPDDFQAQFCGGTLTAPDVVVTAAHCSDFTTAADVQVLVGARRLDGSGTRHDVTEIAIHPDWSPATFDYDVAVWRLAAPAKAAPVATLADADGDTGDALLVTGWGALQENGQFPIDLQALEVPLADRGNCNDADSYAGAITERMLCAGVDAGGIDSCQGDSGGPLTGGAEQGPLVGVVSWGSGCARPNLFGVYARVSAPAIRAFLDANH